MIGFQASKGRQNTPIGSSAIFRINVLRERNLNFEFSYRFASARPAALIYFGVRFTTQAKAPMNRDVGLRLTGALAVCFSGFLSH